MFYLPGGFLILVVAFTSVYLLTPLVGKLALKIGAVDVPGDRKVHQKVMPRLGGLGIYLSFIVIMLLTQEMSRPLVGLLLGGTCITLLGVCDDIFNLPARVKLAGQILAALLVVAFGVRVEFLTNPFHNMIVLGHLAIPVTIFWIVGVTNALNLIDGLDGLAAGTVVISALTLAASAWLEGHVFIVFWTLLLASCVLGFLPHNFHPARIFMGDNGSMFLGFNLAVLSILGLGKGVTAISLFIPVLIVGTPLLDTVLAVARRLVNHRPLFQADKQHLHHCLLGMGLSQRQTVLVLYLVNICLGGSALLLSILTTEQSIILLIGLTMFALWGVNKVKIMAPKPVSVQRSKFLPR
jgi:UDP-GlcNAc:undecaprenyl-phosphate GlcNAc-1-phosphate transferase